MKVSSYNVKNVCGYLDEISYLLSDRSNSLYTVFGKDHRKHIQLALKNNLRTSIDDDEEFLKNLTNVEILLASFMLTTSLEYLQDNFFNAFYDDLMLDSTFASATKHNTELNRMFELLKDRQIFNSIDRELGGCSEELFNLSRRYNMSCIETLKKIRNCLMHGNYTINGSMILFRGLNSFNFDINVCDFHKMIEATYYSVQRIKLVDKNTVQVVSAKRGNNTINPIFRKGDASNKDVLTDIISSGSTSTYIYEESVNLNEDAKVNDEKKRLRFLDCASSDLKSYIDDVALVNAKGAYNLIDASSIINLSVFFNDFVAQNSDKLLLNGNQNQIIRFFMDDCYNYAIISILKAFFLTNYLKEVRENPDLFKNINVAGVKVDFICEDVVSSENVLRHIRNSISHNRYRIDVKNAKDNRKVDKSIIYLEDYDNYGNLSFRGSVSVKAFNKILDSLYYKAVNFYKDNETLSTELSDSDVGEKREGSHK